MGHGSFYKPWLGIGLLLAGCCAGLTVSAPAAETVPYRDIQLTENRICKACQWKLLPKGKVQLTNRQGTSTVVSQKEIVGINNHPIVRKIFMKSLYGIGFPAKDIVPYAFDDAQEYVCKYCE